MKSSNLPINFKKNEIINCIKKHQVLIIEGDTGSGKTTQLPKFAIDAGRGITGRIVCTQPRRIAATSVALRISEEMGYQIGSFVGYKIRFKEKISKNTRIKIVTDGILLTEIHLDPRLNEYDTIMVDEAHERSLNIDLILGILKNLISFRKNLKLIIMSATIDTTKFSNFFRKAPIITIPGRSYPVKISYLPEKYGNEYAISYLYTIVKNIDKICKRKCFGDILIFVPTERDIRELCETISRKQYTKTIILPLFARLSSRKQKKIFRKYDSRKIIISTNIAETSITVPGIKYIIDSGLVRMSKYLPQSGITTLPIVPISKSSANQRKGRCGRIEEGICIRLYTESDYSERPLFTEPEILRSNLSEVILKIISFNLGDIFTFPFIDPPSEHNLHDGLKLLLQLGAIVLRKINQYDLTPYGEIMSKLPIDSRLSRVLIEALKEDCLKEALVIVSALSVGGDFIESHVGSAYQHEIALAHNIFKDSLSDFVTLLNIWNVIHEEEKQSLDINKLKKICNKYYLSFTRAREWIDIHNQIELIMKKQKLPHSQNRLKQKTISSNFAEKSKFSELYQSLHKSIISGFLVNIAVKRNKHCFTTSKGRSLFIFPGSSIFNKGTKTKYFWIIATEFVKTSYLFARRVAVIDPAWIEIVGKPLCKYSWFNPHWEKDKEEVIAYERVRLFGLTIVHGKLVSYGKINSQVANDIFIKHALVNCEVKNMLPFMNFNKDMILSVKDIEKKFRRKDMFVGKKKVALFYKERIGKIYDMRTLQSIIKKRGNDKYLRMSKSYVYNYQPAKEETEKFPDRICFGNKFFDCSYVFNPYEDGDGVTVSIPRNLINHVEQDKISWLIPGLLREKITFLLKGLNKNYRKRLIPLNKTVELIVQEMPRYKENIIVALSNFLFKTLNVEIPPKAWLNNSLPIHLKMRIAIKDKNDITLITSRDESILINENLACNSPNIPAKIKKTWEIYGVKKWDFRDLPYKIINKSKNNETHLFFPRLKLNSSNINIKLFDDLNLATKEHKQGVIKLLSHYFTDDLKFIKRIIKLSNKYYKKNKYFGGSPLIESQIFNKLLEDFFSVNILTKSEFESHISYLKRQKITNHAELRIKQVINIMELFHRISNFTTKLKRSFQENNSLSEFAEIIIKELFRIIPKNFILLYNSKKLDDLLRYLSAIDIRARRGSENLKKDRNRSEFVAPYTFSLESIIKTMDRKTSNEKRLAVEKYFWMIEEYKISIFAQEIKTPLPISHNRLNNFLGKIRMMV